MKNLIKISLVAMLSFGLANAAEAKKQHDPESGLIIADGFDQTKAHCTVCHSAKFITQTGKSEKNWIDSIRWMQNTQGLWDLGEDEKIVVGYLAKNYPETIVSRRANIKSHLMPPNPYDKK